MGIFMILLGIVGMVVNANGWFIIPSLAIKVCFVVGGLIIGFQFFVNGRLTRQVTRRF